MRTFRHISSRFYQSVQGHPVYDLCQHPKYPDCRHHIHDRSGTYHHCLKHNKPSCFFIFHTPRLSTSACVCSHYKAGFLSCPQKPFYIFLHRAAFSFVGFPIFFFLLFFVPRIFLQIISYCFRYTFYFSSQLQASSLSDCNMYKYVSLVFLFLPFCSRSIFNRLHSCRLFSKTDAQNLYFLPLFVIIPFIKMKKSVFRR